MIESTTNSSKPACYREDALAVAKTLRDAGHVAYFAGGCVRDLLMGLTPTDYDVATDAPPTKVRTLFKHTQAVGAAFGVILVRINKSVVEVATFRSDGQYLDGRRPSEVRFTNAEEDAKRRDFTINGLFLDPVSDQVIDHVGGQEDLKSRVLRAIGEAAARFDEDYLRMLRAVRFAARFDLRIDPQTQTAIQKYAPKLAQISPERIAEELRKMLTGSSRISARKLLVELKLLSVIFRQFSEPFDPQSAGALFDGTSTGKPIAFGLALASLITDYRSQNKPHFALLEISEVKRSASICRALLKISNEESEEFVGSLSVLQLLQPIEPTVAIMKRFLASPFSADARQLLNALESTGFQSDRIRWLEAQFATFAPETIAPPPLVTGDDLIASGLQPGKLFKTILDQVYDLQLEGKLATKELALAEALTLAGA